MKRVLVTGATGFVGRTLCETLAQAGYVVRGALRNDRQLPPFVAEKAIVGDIGAATRWASALDGVDAVMHLAARAHVLHDAASNADLYLETNLRGTQRLATAAAEAGVRRFVFLSSIKVNGEQTGDRAYTAADEPKPMDVYGSSKWAAEQALAQIATQTGMQVVTVRPPLVYGPGVRANFLRLMRWIHKGRLLPLGAVDNRRSLVSVWNLCDLLKHTLDNPVAAGRAWLVSDGEDMSTPELIRRIGRAMNRPAKLLAAPVGLLHLAGALTGKKSEIARLCGSLALDAAPTRAELSWTPPLSVDEALERTVRWYLSGVVVA